MQCINLCLIISLLFLCCSKKIVKSGNPAINEPVAAQTNGSNPDRAEEIKRKIAELERKRKEIRMENPEENHDVERLKFHLSKEGKGGGSGEYRKKEDEKKVVKTESLLRASTVKAAAHDDNEEFIAYQQYCESRQFPVSAKWRIDERYIIRVVDTDGLPVSGVNVSVGKTHRSIWNAFTPSSGEIILFPRMDLGIKYSSIKDYQVTINDNEYKINSEQDSYITIQLPHERPARNKIPLQICFLLDATGSMGDELQLLKDVIFSIHSRLLNHPAHPEIDLSVVAYRDRTSRFLVKGYPFTKDIDTFQIQLESISAAGGGDEPEDLDAGLQYALDSLAWNKEAAKFVFLIADAPPHLDYNNKKDYMWAARKAREEAIMITPIGASGLKPLGEFIFRQIAVMTNGEFVFLNYGEKGESKGSGTVTDIGKVSHHTGSNYNSRRLDDIVIDIITRELGYLVSDPALVQEQRNPEDESDLLDIRLTELIMQVFRPGLPLQGKTVALAPFYVADSMLKLTSEFLWESALEKTIKAAQVHVLERSRLEEILKENALELTGLTVENPDPKIGKMLSADYMAFGKILFIGAVRVCYMRLVDCQTGSVVSAARIKL